MRRMVAIQACIALVLGFLQAPLIHLHESQHHEHGLRGQHGHSAIVHAHSPPHPTLLGKHSEDEYEFSHEGHEAKQINTFVVKQETQRSLPVVRIEEGIRFFLPVKLARIFPLFALRTHDPPLLEGLGPRAPPA